MFCFLFLHNLSTLCFIIILTVINSCYLPISSSLLFRLFHFLLLHSLAAASVAAARCVCFQISKANVNGASAAARPNYLTAPIPIPSPSSLHEPRRGWEGREGESRVCERAATERETRADQASVSKHIIMYFFKTQKATPQQRTKQKERDRGRERGSERERGEAKRSWAAGKQKQSVKFMLHEQLSSRSARGSARLPRRSIIRCVRAILFTNKSQGKRASLAITRSASLPPSFPLSCCANTVESLSLAVRSAALTFAH